MRTHAHAPGHAPRRSPAAPPGGVSYGASPTTPFTPRPQRTFSAGRCNPSGRAHSFHPVATARSGLAHRTAHPEASAGHRTIHCSHPEASADYRTMPRINHVIYNLPRLHHVDAAYIPLLCHVYTALICRVLHHIHTHHSRRFLAPHSIESRFYLAVFSFFSRQRRSTAPYSPNFHTQY